MSLISAYFSNVYLYLSKYIHTGSIKELIHHYHATCFSPPKSYNLNVFIDMYKENECFAEEFIEGTMINVFYTRTCFNRISSLFFIYLIYLSRRCFVNL